MAQTLGYNIVEVSKGRVVAGAEPHAGHLNPAGTVHGGLAATLLDSCMGLAIHSMLDRAFAQTTLEFKNLPPDPPVGGHSCNGAMIPRFHRAVCDYFTLRAPCGGADCLVKPRTPLSRLDRLLRAIFAKTVFLASSMAVPA